jgi:hypothetical protein
MNFPNPSKGKFIMYATSLDCLQFAPINSHAAGLKLCRALRQPVITLVNELLYPQQLPSAEKKTPRACSSHTPSSLAHLRPLLEATVRE